MNKKIATYSSFFLSGVLVTIFVFLFLNSSTKFSYYRNTIVSQYDGVVDPDKMQAEIYRGITNGLDDPHSQYFSEEEFEQFSNQLNTGYLGVGFGIYQKETGEIIVSSVSEESPAQKAGIYPGDVINVVDEEEIDDETTDEIIELIKDDKATTLEIYRPSTNEKLTFELTLVEIPNETIRSEIITRNGTNYGLIQIESFAEDTAIDFEDALTELEKQNIQGLIIDLRDNGGGYLEAVEAIMNLIVVNDKPAVTTKKEDKEIDSFTTELSEAKSYPITVVQNSNSASASEILAGALLENNDVEIVGQTSYGKGSVQTEIPVSGGGYAKITTAHWYTPDGNIIDGVGIEPTIPISDEDTIIYGQQVPLDLMLVEDNISIASQQLNADLYMMGYETDPQSTQYTEQTTLSLHQYQSDNNMDQTDGVNSVLMEEIVQDTKELGAVSGNDLYIEEALKTFEE